MSDETAPKSTDRYKTAVARAGHALRLVCAEMPHLAGLAHLVRVVPTRYFNVAAVGPTGVVCINPDLFTRMPLADAAFVLAHELLHLALDTHTRQGDANPHLVNVAHDYVINDMLSADMGRGVPLNGLVRSGARNESLESLVVDLSKQGGGRIGCWNTGRRKRRRRRPQPGKSPIRDALEKAGLVPPEPPPPEPPPDPLGDKNPLGDLLNAAQEEILEPDMPPELRRKLREEIRKAAAKALSLGALRAQIDETQQTGGAGEPQRGEAMMKALHTAYQPPWQLALQRWLDAVAPAGRSYAKASRRGADRDDGVVLCGRLREGWTLHIVLDTSGSMAAALPKILGVIGSFCDGAGVAQVHILQCDIEVTRDEWLEPAQLSEYRIAGFGGSDMSPGMNRLAQDSEVAAVLVLTDGYITFPAREPPYSVLWAVFRDRAGYKSDFSPPYGMVTFLDP
ncbi:MAG TPA: VWA-like domain-containing protein [Gemmataceae bacterium]|nr:VWA-like domain-containing protein [Gemmataceae bacterium]